eukprot:SAG31_NODE_2487_length_5621_cov_4.415248_1_plen_175_part_00
MHYLTVALHHLQAGDAKNVEKQSVCALSLCSPPYRVADLKKRRFQKRFKTSPMDAQTNKPAVKVKAEQEAKKQTKNGLKKTSSAPNRVRCYAHSVQRFAMIYCACPEPCMTSTQATKGGASHLLQVDEDQDSSDGAMRAWWDEESDEDDDDNTKWRTLEHKGVKSKLCGTTHNS